MYNSLPVEIWRQIFAVAVRSCVHAQRLQAAGDDDHDPFNLGSPHLLRHTLKTKLSLCLVSKDFNSLASEFLYECIYFTSHERLISAIRHSTRGGTSKFWWTKVLALRFWYTMGSSVASVAHLLSKCVNLRLLVFAAPTMGPEVGLDQVGSVYRSVPRSVQAVRWVMGDQPIFQNIPTTVLDNICQMSIESRTMMSTPVLTLPRLTYFRAKDPFGPFNLTFPALRSVCFVAWQRNTKLESSPLGLFIQSYAKQITTLRFENGGDFSTMEFPVSLIDCCTNLTTLEYDPFVMCPLQFNDPDTLVQHTKLTHIHLFISVPPDHLAYFSVKLWEINYQWLLLGGFPVLKHICVRRSCVSDSVEEHFLSLIDGACTDPRLNLECRASACT
jgi:hypothetical protein